MSMNETILVLLGFNTLVVLGVGGALIKYLIGNERRLATIEAKLEIHRP